MKLLLTAAMLNLGTTVLRGGAGLAPVVLAAVTWLAAAFLSSAGRGRVGFDAGTAGAGTGFIAGLLCIGCAGPTLGRGGAAFGA